MNYTATISMNGHGHPGQITLSSTKPFSFHSQDGLVFVSDSANEDIVFIVALSAFICFEQTET